MRGMPFNLAGKVALEAIAAQILVGEGQDESGDAFWSGGTGHRRKKGEVLEPRSVLYHRRSPSPPVSTSTRSSSVSGGGGGSTDTAGVAAVSENLPQKWPVSDSAAPLDETGARKEEWAGELQPNTGTPEMGSLAVSVEKCGVGIDDWETMFFASAASPSQEQAFLRWIMGDVDDLSVPKLHHHQPFSSQPPPAEFDGAATGVGFSLVDPVLEFEPLRGISVAAATPTTSLPHSGLLYQSSRNNRFTGSIQPLSPQLSFSPEVFYKEPSEEKPHPFAPNLIFHTQSPPIPSFFVPSFTRATEPHHDSGVLPPHPKRHHSQIPATDSGQLPLRPMKPTPSPAVNEAAMAFHQHQDLVDQLFKAAELVEAGNFISAHGILARLNHHLPSPLGKPLIRSVFHFKDALQLLIANSSSPPSTTPLLITPFDVVLKLSAYKAFSEVSPLLHFTNFTATQTLLEQLGSATLIHIIDFDIGIGGQWSSFLHELAQKGRSSPVQQLKITAFVSLPTFHPLELHLTSEILSHFATELNIPFEINIASIESFDPAEILAKSASTNEAIAVNLPMGASLNPSFSTTLHLVKQLMPKIIVSVDQGCDRSDLSFSHHFLHAFQSSVTLLDSIDAAGCCLDTANKIERFVLRPAIENRVIGRHRAPEQTLQWRALFASAGFVPMQFSNFTEMQAESLLKRIPFRGFHVERSQASLHLHWQRRELASVSAWRC
ncbi:Scarecrow-like protein 6 [Platanthera zijinensis]|uniref:Scarecrow-like protein 6 n=1 Tax=Platanthera zijinensis TaxID=2320716 RepID=A0AAP0C121_9ASPA